MPTYLPTYLPTYIHTYIHMYTYIYIHIRIEREREREREMFFCSVMMAPKRPQNPLQTLRDPNHIKGDSLLPQILTEP